MKQRNNKAWAEKGPNLCVYLDAPLRNNAENEKFTRTTFVGHDAIDHSVLDVERFINSLSVDEQKIVIMRMAGQSTQSISTVLKVSSYRINLILDTIRTKLQNYYGDAFIITEDKRNSRVQMICTRVG